MNKIKLYTNFFLKRRELNSENELPETELRIQADSQVYYPKRKLHIKHKKFSAQSGLFLVGLESAGTISLTNSIEYTRTVDQASQRLVSGDYIWSMSTGPSYTKNCTMKVQSGDNYYNYVNCKLQAGTTLPEVSYGYALKVNQVKEILFGRRSAELNINIPARTLRFEYDAHYSNPLNTNDDDDDDNNEREGNGTIKFFPNFNKEPNRVAVVSFKRDNFARGQSKTKVDVVVNGPTLTSVNLEVRRFRKINQTRFEASLGYQLKNGKSNRLDLNGVMVSDLNTNQFSVEESLQRPVLNVAYQSKFNK